MDFLELQSFVTICDCRNITEAARRLFITQPALSRRIRELEKELGLELFVRRSKGIEVTEAGLRLYADAVQILDHRKCFSAKALQLQEAITGSLRIAVSSDWPRIPVLRGISAMAQNYPEVTQIFKTDLSPGYPYLLLQNQLDVVLCEKAELSGISGICYEVLYENSLSVFVGRKHKFWTKEHISWEDLAGETILIYQGITQSIGFHIELTLRKICPSIKQIYFCRSKEECIFYATAGRAIALCGTDKCLSWISDVLRNIPVKEASMDWISSVAAYNVENSLALTFIEYIKRGVGFN